MDKFAQIISASRDAAHPTAAQAASGCYKKGRVTLYGLKIAIETAQGTRRVGKTDGEPWSVISQAHYGELVGTKASDGDPLDVFIGPWPETEMVYVINQVNKDDSFDEVKIMLCFPSEESARNAYMNSYERGWNGLGSLVRCTVEQLKWWLKFGNTTLPLTAKSLPYDGNAEMNETVWDSAANPVGTDLAGLIYALRRTDADGLLLDAVTVADIMEDADAEMALDALVIPLNKLERKMQQMQVIMAGIGEAVKPIAMQITSPFKQRGTTNVAAIFELSDGQTVSIFFHNPDTTPNKLTPDDEMVSWKWLLNKKDVTILVAPEKGRDLNPREVGRRVMRLAEKNSTRFAAANTKKAERMQSIEVLKQSTAAKEAELVKLQTEIVELTPRVEAKRRTQAPTPAGNDYLPAGWVESTLGGMASNGDPLVGGIVDREIANKDNWFIVFNNNAIPQDKRVFSSRNEAFKAFEQAIAAVKAPEAPGHTGSDLPPLTVRNQAVKVALSALGWNTSAGSTQANLDIDGSLYSIKSTQVKNAIEWRDMSTLIATDDLSKTPEAFAAELDAAFRSSVAKARKASSFNPENPDDYRQIWGGGGNVQLAEAHQDQLDSLFQGRLIAVRNALRDLGWEGEKYKPLSKNGNTLVPDLWQVGAGANIVGIVYKVTGPSTTAGAADGVRDDLSVTPAELAAEIDGFVSKAAQEDAGLPKMTVKSATLVWSEGSMDENKAFTSLAALDQWFKATFPGKRMEERGVGRGYWKNRLVIRSTDESGNAHENTTRVDVSRTQGDFDPTKQTIAQYLSKEGFGSVSPGMAEIVDAPDRHYSEVIKDELVSSYGWKRTSTGSLSKDMGGADAGGEFNKEGKRIVSASFDDTDRYLTLQFGFETVFDMDCRDLDPKEAAATFNARVAEWADNAAGATGRRGLSAADRAWAERIVANEDYMPWADVRRAKEMLGLPTESDDAELLKTPEGRQILADRMRSSSTIAGVSAILKSQNWVSRGAMTWDRGAYHLAAGNGEFIVSEYVNGELVERARVPLTGDDGAVVKAIEDAEEAARRAAGERTAQTEDDAEQAKYTPFNRASVKMPTAVQLSMNMRGQPILVTYKDQEGWTNGHILALHRPKLLADAIKKYHVDDTNLRKLGEDAVSRVIPRDATLRLEPKALYEAGEKQKQVVLMDESSAIAVPVDLRYFGYFDRQFKQPDYFVSPDGEGSIVVKRAGKVVGVMMPIRADKSNVLRRAAKAAGPVAQGLSDAQKALEKAGFDPFIFKTYPGLSDATAAGAITYKALPSPGQGQLDPQGMLAGNGIKYPVYWSQIDLAKQLASDAQASALKAEAESGAGAPEPSDDAALTDSKAFLQTVIDGSADMMDPDLADQLTKAAEDYADDDSVMALFNEAAEAYSNFMIAEARKALA